MLYQTRPKHVFAIQLRENNLESFFNFIGERANYPECKVGGINPETGKMMIKANLIGIPIIGEAPGFVVLPIGFWLVRYLSHEFVIMSNDDFQQTYMLDQ